MEFKREAIDEVLKILEIHKRDLLAMAMSHAAARGAEEVAVEDIEYAHTQLFL